MRVDSDTFCDPFYKRSYKISKLHDYSIALQHCQKMGMILENKVIRKLKLLKKGPEKFRGFLTFSL